MTWGIKISKPTFDVRTCESKDLIMSSEFDILKTKMVGTTTTSALHGMAYIPPFFAIEILTDSGTEYGTFVGSGTSGTTFAYINATRIYAGFNKTKYYIFYEES